MRKIFSLLLSIFILVQIFAQSPGKPAAPPKNDVIMKVNGEELTGKVSEIGDDAVKFTYAGETLSYTIKKVDILKITFASGRIEFYNKQPLPSETKAPQSSGGPTLITDESHHNKVAILPFAFLRDGQLAADQLSEKAQEHCFNFLSKHAGVFTILEPRTTNALLLKSGITKDNIKSFTMDDTCTALGVEYVLEGVVMMNKAAQTSSQSTNYNSKTKYDETNTKNKGTVSTYSTTTQNYETNLTVNIYNDKGSSVFGQERRSFFTTQDAYQNAMEYLLKRCPLYQK